MSTRSVRARRAGVWVFLCALLALGCGSNEGTRPPRTVTEPTPVVITEHGAPQVRPAPVVTTPSPAAPPADTTSPRRAEQAAASAEPEDLLNSALRGSGSGSAVGSGHGGGLGVGGIGMGGGGRGLRSRSAYGAPMGEATADGAFARTSPDFNRDQYAHVRPNGFIAVRDQPLSTFSTDVDTASYSNVRRFIQEGSLPPASAVRVEEMVNYFRFRFPEPEGDSPFGMHAEVGPCPWAPDHRLVMLGLKTRAISDEAVPPRNLVFLIDVSGSMESPDKLPLLKQAMTLLVDQLRPQDRVAMVVYAGSSGLVLPSTPGTNRAAILASLERLEAGGSTNGGEGIQLAYREAESHFERGAINRVILATDGDFNVGVSSEGELVRLIEEKRRTGVYLTVLGFGRGNLGDSRMEALADAGNGNYGYVDSVSEARRLLVREAGATLVPVADDVKIQIELNPARVAEYRLLGYENRLLQAHEFDDDRRDAGEVGAGHTVTALYEVVPIGAATQATTAPALRYQTDRAPTAAATEGELLTFKIRFKAPGQATSRLAQRVVQDVFGTPETSADFRFATAVAGFGLWLRRDPLLPAGFDLAALTAMATQSTGDDPHGDRHELVSLMHRARDLPR